MSVVMRAFLLIAATLLLVAGGVFFNGLSLRVSRLAHDRNDTMQLARTVALDMDRIFDGAHQLLATLAKLPEGKGWDSRACSPFRPTTTKWTSADCARCC